MHNEVFGSWRWFSPSPPTAYHRGFDVDHRRPTSPRELEEPTPRPFPRPVFGRPAAALRLVAFRRRASKRTCERIDFDRDAAFGVHDDSLLPVGVAHLALLDDHAELGLSVLPGHRGRGLGSALFERGAAHARNRCVRTLFMHCLRENSAIVRIARRFGMGIVVDYGEADAHIELPPASAESIAGEFVADRLALYDYALKSHVAAWKGVGDGIGRRCPRNPLRCDFGALAGVGRAVTATNVTPDRYLAHLRGTLERIRADGFYKSERVIRTPQMPALGLAGGAAVVNFCANNYLGLADDPQLVAAARDGLDRYGYRHGVGALHLRHAKRAPRARSRACRISRHRRRDPLLELLRRERRALRDAARRRGRRDQRRAQSREHRRRHQALQGAPLPLSQQRHGGSRGAVSPRPTPPARASS